MNANSVVTEPWLDAAIFDSEIHIENFTPMRMKWSDGIGIYVKIPTDGSSVLY